ncbi:MAG TPA: ATP-binding protein [Blastocatellia bacterium]|nr:ATP-binding protein [Blastocatellia bacterium]
MKSVLENRVRFVIAIFFIAILAAIGSGLGYYLKTSDDLAKQKLYQVRLQAALLASVISTRSTAPSDKVLWGYLRKYGIDAAAVLHDSNDNVIAQASTINEAPPAHLLAPGREPPKPPPSGAGEPRAGALLEQTLARTEDGFDVVVARVGNGKEGESQVLTIAQPVDAQPAPAIVYILSYQLLALILGMGLLVALIRWLLRPYRRMVEAAKGSPIRASSAQSESQFVVETFQALIAQLQAKEKELEALHKMERTRAERSERFSERLVANIPSGLVVVNSKGIVTTTNTSASHIFGLKDSASDSVPAEAAPNLRTVQIEHQLFFSGAPKMARLVTECLAESASFRREEVEIVNSEGRTRHLGVSISPITDATHQVEGALCLITDITEVMELRDRMKLQENLANLGEMAAGLAHEFKNSLATIQGYIQLFDAQGSSDKGKHQIETQEAALNEVRLLAHLVTDFLNFARPQRLTLAMTDLRSIIEDSTGELGPSLRDSGINLTVAGEFASLRGDESMLRRAFSNLIRNAAEAIDSGSNNREIEITGAVDNGSEPRYAHVRIRDTGGGISTGNLQRIFIPFFTTKSRGYGIGLALVQKIFIAHGGSVSVDSSDDRGTVFHCRLPISAANLVVEESSHIAY